MLDKILEKKAKLIAESRQVLFRALRAGWVSGAKAKPVPGFTDYKQYVYEEGPWKVVDMYYSSSLGGKRSGGFTTIWYQGMIFWSMTYGGEYCKEVISLLKKALRVNYDKDIFDAGRGPDYFVSDGCIYQNVVNEGSCFDNFHCTESITDGQTGANMGYHVCFGGIAF